MELDIGWKSTPAIINDIPVIYCLYWEGGGGGGGGGGKYRKGGEDIVTIFSPRGENIGGGGWKYRITPACYGSDFGTIIGTILTLYCMLWQ